jgi:hypothetical protein
MGLMQQRFLDNSERDEQSGSPTFRRDLDNGLDHPIGR